MNKKYLLIALALYKFALMNFALFVLIRYTSLGDNEAYTSLGFFTAVSRDHHVISLTTALTQMMVLGVETLLFHNIYLTNLFFNILSFIGIAIAIGKINLKNDLVSWLFVLLLFFPNFNLWASIAGKEAILVFFSGYVIRVLSDYFEYDTYPGYLASSFSWLQISVKLILLSFCTGMVLLYKPAFAIFILPLFAFFAFRKININSRLLAYCLSVVVFIIICYLIRERIDYFTRHIDEAFPATAHSNRDNIWTYRFAFFYTIPYTMWVALWGPLWGELNNATKILSFFESLLLFLGFLAFFLVFIINSYHNKVKWAVPCVLIISILLCIITLSAMGYTNPGTAIRYRTNNYLFLLIFFYYLSRINSGYARQAEIANNRQFSA